jgi:hypothetical protein
MLEEPKPPPSGANAHFCREYAAAGIQLPPLIPKHPFSRDKQKIFGFFMISRMGQNQTSDRPSFFELYRPALLLT